MHEPLLAVSGLTKTFRRGGKAVPAVEDVGFAIMPGETLALAGPSGSGKSTVARLLLRLVEPDSGDIRFEGEDWLALRGGTAMPPSTRATVARVLDDPLRIHGIASRSERPRRIAGLLERVGLPAGLAARTVHELSGGQRQRVAIARAIATKPSLIVLDEAVSALDVSVRGQILELLLALQREERIAYLFISHDLGLVRAFAHRLILLEGGRIAEQGDARAVVDAPRSAVGRALVAAAPKLVAGQERP